MDALLPMFARYIASDPNARVTLTLVLGGTVVIGTAMAPVEWYEQYALSFDDQSPDVASTWRAVNAVRNLALAEGGEAAAELDLDMASTVLCLADVIVSGPELPVVPTTPSGIFMRVPVAGVQAWSVGAIVRRPIP